MKTLTATAALLAALLLLVQRPLPAQGTDAFAFFSPTLVPTADERRQLARGQPVARVLTGDGSEVAVAAIVPVSVDADRFVSWIRRIELLKKSDYVPQIGRFSSPPRLTDLSALSLDDDEIADLRRCRPQKCALKLSPDEVTAVVSAMSAAGHDWQTAGQAAFRQIVLNRALAYLAVRPDSGVWPAGAYARLARRSEYLTGSLPLVADDISRAPDERRATPEAFLYWSKERLSGKPAVIVTDVGIVRGLGAGQPEAIVIGKQLMATHYLDASLGVTALVRGEAQGAYLVYLNRSEVDVLRGMFGGVVRWAAERRLRTEAVRVLDGLRRRIEGGEPG